MAYLEGPIEEIENMTIRQLREDFGKKTFVKLGVLAELEEGIKGKEKKQQRYDLMEYFLREEGKENSTPKESTQKRKEREED